MEGSLQLGLTVEDMSGQDREWWLNRLIKQLKKENEALKKGGRKR